MGEPHTIEFLEASRRFQKHLEARGSRWNNNYPLPFHCESGKLKYRNVRQSVLNSAIQVKNKRYGNKFCMVAGKSSGVVVGIGTGANDSILLCQSSPPTYVDCRKFLDEYLFFLAWGGCWILVMSAVLRACLRCGVGAKKKLSFNQFFAIFALFQMKSHILQGSKSDFRKLLEIFLDFWPIFDFL